MTRGTRESRDSRRDGARRASFTERLARTSATHPWRMMAVCLAVIAVAVLTMSSLLESGLTSDMEFRGKDPDSIIGQKLVQDRLTGPQRLSDFVIVRSSDHTVDDEAFKTYVEGLAGEIGGLGDGIVQGVVTYYQANDPTLVSKDQHATLVQVVMAAETGDEALEHVDELRAVVVAGEGSGFTLQQTGDVSLGDMGMRLAESDLQRAEIFGMPAALIVLLLVFGAVLAATMPLILSIVSIILGLTLTGLIGQLYPMNTFVLNILIMMGLAVGIDYTLFIISRYREERARGLAKIDAIAATGATANRAIFFSGMTVFLAMLGMVIVPLDITISMGLGVMLVVFTTLLTSLILLPAVMSLLGDRINALRIPLIGRLAARGEGHEGVWERLSHSIMRRPVIWLTVAVTVLLAAAAPVLVLKTGNTQMTAANYPAGEYAKQGWDTLARDFSLGKANPLHIVIDGDAASAETLKDVEALQAALAEDGRFGPSQPVVSEAGDLTVVSTTMAGDPAGDATQGTVRELRSDLIPAVFAGSDAEVYVSGNTAFVVDYLDFFNTWLPIALAVVLSLSFVLLLVAFRSIVIPAKAILMNLLSVGAAYGLLVLVFQKGIGADLLGLTQVETIEAWVPLLLFSMLFGLSMDYQVFLLSRIKERFDETGDTREAVAHGIGRTAGIITGAAAIMVCVFGGMATGELVMFQQMGFGLAVAIFIDATVVRTIIVPAGMELLGDWNWYLPRWLEWLPNVSVEGHAYEPETESHGDAGRTPEGVRGGEPVRPQPRTQPAFAVTRTGGARGGK